MHIIRTIDKNKLLKKHQAAGLLEAPFHLLTMRQNCNSLRGKYGKVWCTKTTDFSSLLLASVPAPAPAIVSASAPSVHSFSTCYFGIDFSTCFDTDTPFGICYNTCLITCISSGFCTCSSLSTDPFVTSKKRPTQMLMQKIK